MLPKKRIFYIVSHIQKSVAFEWTANGLKNYCNLTFILFNPNSSSLELFLKANGVNVIRISYRDKWNSPAAFFRLCWIFVTNRPDIVHTHLFDATLIGLTVAWLTRIKKRIYTRHNSTFHHLYFPNAVKYDRWNNALATHIVSISQATDYTLLQMENVSFSKLRKIPHGFDFDLFAFTDKSRVEKVRNRWNISSNKKHVGVVARHIEWKGVQYVIPAFIKFLNSNPDACLILANASGPHHQEILTLLADIPKENVILIPFEEDMAALYKTFHVYIHTPIDSTCEAFGQTYVEALASEVPSIFTLSGIAAEFIQHGKNAIVVDFKNSDQICDALHQLWSDEKMRSALVNDGSQSINPEFALSLMLHRLKELYNEQ